MTPTPDSLLGKRFEFRDFAKEQYSLIIVSHFEVNVSPKFKKGKKGYSPKEVDSYISMLSAKFSENQTRMKLLEAELEQSFEQLKTSDSIDEKTLAGILGNSVARILTTAKREADIMTRESIASAEKMIADAKYEVKDIHERGERAVKERVEAAKAETGKLKAEALAVRQKTLEDLSRRKKEVSAQVERLTTGRDRLINSFETSQQLLNEIKGKVNESLANARIAADAAANRITSRPALTSDELEKEIAEAKLLGLTQSVYNPGVESLIELEILEKELEIPQAPIFSPKTSIPKIEPTPEITPIPKIEQIEPVINKSVINKSAPKIPTPNLDKAVKHITTPTAKEERDNTTSTLFEKLKKEQSEKSERKRLEKTVPVKENFKENALSLPKPKEIEKEEIEKEEIKVELEVIEPEAIEPEEVPNAAEMINKLSESLERQIKYGLAQDQNQVLDTLRQTKRNKELPPAQDQATAYIEAIDNDELSQSVNQKVIITTELVLEHLVTPLRENLNSCLGESEGAGNEMQIQKEIRDSYRNFKQIECSKIAHDLAVRVLDLN